MNEFVSVNTQTDNQHMIHSIIYEKHLFSFSWEEGLYT